MLDDLQQTYRFSIIEIRISITFGLIVITIIYNFNGIKSLYIEQIISLKSKFKTKINKELLAFFILNDDRNGF